MGSVNFYLEGEIAIAKVEAGRNTYIGGLCESPLTFQAITIWREELLDEKIMLRDVIDLDATFGSMSESELPEEVKIEGFENQNPTSEIGDDNLKESLAQKFNIKAKNSSDEKEGDLEPLEDEEGEDFEEDHANVSLAAMESSLKPQVLKTLKKIADAYSKLTSLQKNIMLAEIKEKKSFKRRKEISKFKE